MGRRDQTPGGDVPEGAAGQSDPEAPGSKQVLRGPRQLGQVQAAKLIARCAQEGRRTQYDPKKLRGEAIDRLQHPRQLQLAAPPVRRGRQSTDQRKGVPITAHIDE